MKIFITRHGETDWNKEGKMQGLTDIELNATGINQAIETKKKLKNINFDLCISSPLKRASKTAEIIIGNKCKMVYDDLLIERCLGDYEGKNPNEKRINHSKYWDYKTNCSEDHVEPLQTLLKRGKIFIDKLKNEYSSYQNILIVSHGSLIKALYYNLKGFDDNIDFFSFFLKNCEVFEYEINTK